MAAAPGAALPENGGARRVFAASASRAPTRAPRRAGRPASRTVAAVTAASARSIRSSLAGRNNRRKKSLGMTLAASGTASFSGGFRFFDALPVAPALPVALLFACRRGAVGLLGFPLRPLARRRPALFAAIALPRVCGVEAPFASLQQTSPGSESATPPAGHWRLGCKILGRAPGR